MHTTAAAPQESPVEPKDQTIAVRCTRAEKDDVQLVKAFDQTTESDTLRELTMDQVRERAAAIRAGEARPRFRAAS